MCFAKELSLSSLLNLCRCKLRRGCDLDVSETLHVLDDRLFDYVEKECDGDVAGSYLAYCVKISDLIRDPIQ